MKNKNLKKIYSAFVISLLLFSQTKIAQAGTSISNVGKLWGISGPGMFATEMMEGIGLDPAAIKSFSEGINVSSLKKTPPQVSLFFSPTNPSEGEKITVTASPTYFMNDPKDLYFTWFLKNEDCDKCDRGKCESTVLKKCDLNFDDRVNIEDYKIKATQIIVNGGFVVKDASTLYQSESDDDGYRAITGGNDQKGKNAHCFVHDTESGKEYEINCGDWSYDTDEDNNGYQRHLFPNAPNDTTGDNDFDRNEEKFWRTDPNSNDTANRGNSDEANVAGLGITNFSWNYQKGDRVGVAIEGISTEPTKEEDSSYKTMWAISKSAYDLNAHLKNNDYPNTTDETISTTIDGLNTVTRVKTTLQEIDGEIVNGIATIKITETLHDITRVTATQALVSDVDVVEDYDAVPPVINPTITYSTENFSGEFDVSNDSIGNIEYPSDLNDFLYKALVSPQENTPGSNKLEINLSYSPNNPINDPNGENGDLLTIHSSIPNAKDGNYIQYKWEVFASDEVTPDDGGTPILKPSLLESTQSTGLGIDTFKFRLAFPETFTSKDGATKDLKFLRVFLTATENTGEDYPRASSQDIIIPITSAEEQIIAHTIVAESSTNPENKSGVDLNLGNEICNNDENPMEKALCSVTKNQIVGLSVPETNFPIETSEFLWTIDGKPFSYAYCFFKNCNPEKQTNVAYFPVLKEVGEQYTINLTATNKDGEKINVTKNFAVVDPEITIISTDTTKCNRVILGNYTDVNGTEFPDYSKFNFWAFNDSNIKLKVLPTGFYIPPENYSWDIDGTSITAYNAGLYGFEIDSDGVLTLPPKEIQGESYNISVGALYAQNNLVKKALNAIWGVTYSQFYEKIISDNATITMQDGPTKRLGGIKTKKIFASIYSSTPAYLAFLLRIILTISLILFVTKLVFSFAPGINSQEEEN